MNAQQMVEHFTDAVKIANGKMKLPEVNSGEKQHNIRDFLFSDIPFKENTRNPLMNEVPSDATHGSIEESVQALQNEFIYFFHLFERDPSVTTCNPIFGELNFEQNVHLLHKHAIHHLRQFGLMQINVALPAS